VSLVLLLVAARAGASGPPESDASRAARVIRAEFGAGWLGGCMLAIAGRESAFNPRAANWTDVHSDGSRGSFGLFQIGAVHRRAGESPHSFARRMFDAAANARLAHVLYRVAGLGPWGGYCR
jgi:hypothetical protein